MADHLLSSRPKKRSFFPDGFALRKPEGSFTAKGKKSGQKPLNLPSLGWQDTML
jgi:hypothetical protein